MQNRKLGIVVDSSFNIELATKLFPDISIVSLKIIINNVVYDDVQMKPAVLLDYVNQKQKITTSQPNPNLFVEAFEKQFSLGYEHVVCLTLSHKLSGTYNSANIAKNMLNNKKISIIDTKTIGPGINYILENLHYHLSNNKLEEEQIFDHIVLEQQKGFFYFVVDDLKYLLAQGRINKFNFFIGNLFKIKPIMEIKNGSILVKKKIRNIHNCIPYLVNQVQEYIAIHPEIEFYFFYTNKTLYIEELIKQFKTLVGDKVKIRAFLVCSVITISVGPNAFGIAVYKKINKK